MEKLLWSIERMEKLLWSIVRMENLLWSVVRIEKLLCSVVRMEYSKVKKLLCRIGKGLKPNSTGI